MKRRDFLKGLLASASLTSAVEAKEKSAKKVFDVGCRYCGCISSRLLAIPEEVTMKIMDKNIKVIAAKVVVCPTCLAELLDKTFQGEPK